MTLRATIKSFIKSCLQSALDWAKRNRDYWGEIQSRYKVKLDEEILLSKMRKEAKEKKEGRM